TYDLKQAGADNQGNTDIDDIFNSLIKIQPKDGNTSITVQIPAGYYKVKQLTFDSSSSNINIEGLAGAILVGDND
ncbi:hypothetical protein, partial [Staphylococcus haemolyticus]